MAERSLPSRRRKKADPGKPIRVSKVVFAELDKSRRKLSWDCFFRSMLGLPTRKGKAQPLVEGMLDMHTGLVLLKGDLTWAEVENWAANLAASNAKKLGDRLMQPIRVREVR